jgi:hypothetical protein
MQVRYQLRQRPVAPDDTTDLLFRRRLRNLTGTETKCRPYGTAEDTGGVVFSIAPQPLNCRCRSS